MQQMNQESTPRHDGKPLLTSENGGNVEPSVEFLGGPAKITAASSVSSVQETLSGAGQESCQANPVASNGGTVVAPPAQFASEAGHWYLPDGTPFYSIENKSKPGKFRPVTLTDAKKVGAVPSVTTVTGLIKGEGLINYIRRQVFQATLACPRPLKGETPEAHMARALAMAEQHKEKAAERGTGLHGAIEQYLIRGDAMSLKWEAHVEGMVDVLKLHGIDLGEGSPEKSFAHPLGFGGKCDWHCRGLADVDGCVVSDPTVIDFKSKDSIDPGKKYAYDEHAMQLASYAIGLGLGIRVTRCINVFIGEQDQRILVHEWTEADLSSAWEQFKHLLCVWQIRKKYCPAFGPEEKEE